MPLNTDNWDDLVKNALVVWRQGYQDVPERARSLYDLQGNPWKTSEYSHIDPPGYAKRKDEGDPFTIGSPQQGYSLSLTKSRIALGDSITWEMRKYDKYREIEKKMKGLGSSTANRIELDLTHMFTFGLQGSTYVNMDGETVSVTTGDGVQLFSDSHTMTGASGNTDNYNGTTAFSRTGLEAGERLFTNMVNMQGVKVVPQPDTIITSDDPAMVNAVGEFMKSVKIPDSPEHATNVYQGKYKHLVLPLLATDLNGAPSSTGRYYWMLADLKAKDAVLEFSEMPTFEMANPKSNGDDFKTGDWWAKSAASYAYGVLDYKWAVGAAATSV